MNFLILIHNIKNNIHYHNIIGLAYKQKAKEYFNLL
jgi:hypothetical protein